MTRPCRDEALPRETRRETFERDGEQCTFVSKDGERCAETGGLEIDHVTPRAQGGTNDLANTRVLCRWHNAYEAERILGREKMDRARGRARERAQALLPRREPSMPDGRTSGDHSVFDEVKLGLVKLGFRMRDVEQALIQVRSKNKPHAELARNDQMVSMIRESLALLTAC